MTGVERWTLEHEGRTHVVEVDPAGLGRSITWRCDDELVVERRTWDDTVRLVPPDDAGTPGAVRLRFGAFGPARRVTWYDTTEHLDAASVAELGVGGYDLLPEPGSKAALRDAWIDAHPNLHTAKRTATALLGVLLSLLTAWLLARFALPAIPWPDWDLPRIPWPDWDLPSIPWPQIDLPRIPWPDWDLALPWWVKEVGEYAKYVVPIVVAFAVAQSEVRRRRAQRERRAQAGAATQPSADRDESSERVDLTRRS